jgi:hypothetical protein
MIKDKRKIMEDALYHWLFHFNHHTQTWNGFHRDDYFAYWNGTKPTRAIIRAKDIKVIHELIIKTDGDKTKMNELTRGTGKN